MHKRPIAEPLSALLSVVLLFSTPGYAAGSEPAARQPEATALTAFDRYVQLTSARVEKELRAEGPYLWVDLQPAATRARYAETLKNGEVVIESLPPRENGKEILFPDAYVHHWIGTVFIPGVTLDQYLAFAQDYNHHQQYFKPDVARSQLLERKGDDFKVFFRFHKRKFFVTVVHDTWHDAHYYRLHARRAGSWTRTTKIEDVDNPGESNEKYRTPEEDRGFLWRLYTWWRFEERDGGVYVQSESVSLTRDIPFGTGWLVKDFPREQLASTLGATRRVLMERHAPRLPR